MVKTEQIDSCATLGLMAFEQALARLLQSVTCVQERETLALNQALGRVLAQDIVSPLNVPPHDNSAMDGYAFAAQSLNDNQSLTLIGRSMAGQPFQGNCPPGQCVRIMTGAILPKGCDSVQMQENCEVLPNDNIVIKGNIVKGGHVRLAGEDIAQGQIIFEQGKRLTAADLGVLASIGVANVSVFRRLKVAILSTGDELKRPEQSLEPGDIYESNSTFLAAMLAKFGAEVLSLGIIADDKDAIKQAFEHANEHADVVISSGGVSVGDADHTKTVLEEIGEIDFWKVAIKPGKPFAFGQLSNSYFFGLPGNPVSAMVTTHQLVLPAIAKMQNMTLPKPVQLRAIAQSSIKKSPGRKDFQRGVYAVNEEGSIVVESTGNQGSGVLTSVARANCYIVLAAEQGSVNAGQQVTIELFDQFLQ